MAPTWSFLSGGSFSITGDAAFNLLNNSGGHIVSGGSIFVITESDLTAGSINAFINNRDGGLIDEGGNIIFSIGGDLTTTDGDFSLVISSRNDGGGAGSVDEGGAISLSANDIFVGGDLLTSISGNGDTSISPSNTIFEAPLPPAAGLVSRFRTAGTLRSVSSGAVPSRETPFSLSLPRSFPPAPPSVHSSAMLMAVASVGTRFSASA